MCSPSECDSKYVLKRGVHRNVVLRMTQDVSGCVYTLVLGLFKMIIFWSPAPLFILTVYMLERRRHAQTAQS